MTMFIAGGCWDRREPESLVFPSILGIDVAEDELFEVIALIPNPSARAGGAAGITGGGAFAVPFWVNSGRGHTPFEALKQLALTTSRQINLSHVDVILISENLARRGIGPVLELYLRNPDIRLIAEIAVVEGGLKNLLESEIPLEPTPALGLLSMLEFARQERSQIPRGDFLEKLKLISLPGVDPVLVRFTVLEGAQPETPADSGSTQDQSQSQGQGQSRVPKPVVKIHGAAAFDGDRMVGWLEDRESVGVNWLLNSISRTIVTVDSPRGGVITLELKQSGCQITPVVSGDSVSMEVKVGALARVQDAVAGSHSSHVVFDAEDPELVRSVTERVAQAVRNDIELALKRARELGVDPFGFGNSIYRKKPQFWNEVVQDRWKEMIKTVEVSLEIQVFLRRTGLVMSSLTPR